MVMRMPDHPYARAKTDDPAARRDRVLRKAAETLQRLELQAIEHKAWRHDPQRIASAEAAEEWLHDLMQRKADGRIQ